MNKHYPFHFPEPSDPDYVYCFNARATLDALRTRRTLLGRMRAWLRSTLS